MATTTEHAPSSDTPAEDTALREAAGTLLTCPKIATLTTCFLEDEAISLNGRQYPREAVDQLIRSAQGQLSAPGNPPLTCYISHDAADQDDSLKLVGKITRVWREGSRAMAEIDIANTTAGRDAATLALGGYLVTQSLRASNAELRRVADNAWPQVGGANLLLQGIDFTATPGIQVARIQNVALAESDATGWQRYQEVFRADPARMTLEYEDSMTKQQQQPLPLTPSSSAPAAAVVGTVTEVAGGNMPLAYNPTDGNTVGMTLDPTRSDYAQRQYPVPQLDPPGPMQGMEPAPELQEAHDRIAMVQRRACAPARESARWQVAFAGLTEGQRRLAEAGRAISARNDANLDAAHHAIAKNLKMECEGANNKLSAFDPDGDGDDDSSTDRTKNPDFALDQLNGVTPNESAARPPARVAPPAAQPQAPLSMDQAVRLLSQAGWHLSRPKTEAEQLQESIATQMREMREAHTRELAELRAQVTAAATPLASAPVAEPAPTRKSMVMGATNQQQPGPNSIRGSLYQHGKYLRERLTTLDWQQLADRTAPLPDDLQLDWLLKEFEQLYAVQYDDRFHILSAAELR